MLHKLCTKDSQCSYTYLAWTNQLSRKTIHQYLYELGLNCKDVARPVAGAVAFEAEFHRPRLVRPNLTLSFLDI